MNKKFEITLFIFRRDLRLEDNTGLIFALKYSEIVIPAFIFTVEQIEKNPFKNDHCLKFMLESLEDLNNQLKQKGSELYFFKGKIEEIVSQCIPKLSIKALIVNRDYTPYSQKRDKTLKSICKVHKVPFFSFDDALLHPPEETLKQNGKPYMIFTPYFRNASKLSVLPPTRNLMNNYFHGSIAFAEKKSILSKMLSTLTIQNHLLGGRTECLKILKDLNSYKKYESLKNFPHEDCSTHLSPYLKFTVCSPREVFFAISRDLGPDHELIRALYWRDFFTTIAFYFPYVFKSAFYSKFNGLKWSYDIKAFNRWSKGRTGFPIVDAGMREMNETGFMHNRVRMIVASFLVKDLGIDWRWGEKYFAKTLIDYDPSVNNGNWQWVASTGCDAQPYFRIFNPWTQQKKIDPQCVYIKKWISEFRNIPPAIIHRWQESEMHAHCPAYPVPMVDHEKSAKAAILAYQGLHR